MKNRGFTLVELITTFALFIIILTVVINIILSIKNIYYNYDLKTELLINQGNMIQEINKKFYRGNLISFTPVDNNEYNFWFSDDVLNPVTLKVTSSSISFGNYIYKLSEGTTPGELSVTTVTVDGANAFLVIKIPLSNVLYKNEDFGLNLVYGY